MRKDPDGTIVLSQRNLLSLLTKTFQPGSACTIVGDDEYGRLVVKAETDEVHYGDRKYPPGKMHPLTEKVLKVIKDEALPIDWL